ncbi:TetR/AcrR family transcriptional regulator [Sphingobium amiense]|uniref:TetR/AcrR family transcriptional regulator n=2 Tax=Sphingobium amiense TaxID=135719 RepID=A0A494VX99_9SPHN|nr:TetR/AcrR family transcriptional regulator [Sphingobium amiense]
MGRSSNEQATRNRAKIVDRASALFRRSGVEPISVAGVMAATGMTVGGFYKHFGSKDDLVAESMKLAFDGSLRSWRAASSIVAHYFAKKPADQTCPIQAFAPYVADDAASPTSREAYAEGARALLEQFLRHECAPSAADEDQGDRGRLLFSAMVGAEFLARATYGADWAKELQSVVERASKN